MFYDTDNDSDSSNSTNEGAAVCGETKNDCELLNLFSGDQRRKLYYWRSWRESQVLRVYS